jgi:hypothetical protein
MGLHIHGILCKMLAAIRALQLDFDARELFALMYAYFHPELGGSFTSDFQKT